MKTCRIEELVISRLREEVDLQHWVMNESDLGSDEKQYAAGIEDALYMVLEHFGDEDHVAQTQEIQSDA